MPDITLSLSLPPGPSKGTMSGADVQGDGQAVGQ